MVDEVKLAKCVIVVQLSVADCVVMALRVGQLLWREVIVDKRTDPPYYAGSYGLVYELRSGPTADPHYTRGFIGKNRRPCSDNISSCSQCALLLHRFNFQDNNKNRINRNLSP